MRPVRIGQACNRLGSGLQTDIFVVDDDERWFMVFIAEG
jgi:hypothetical protein